MEDIRQMDGSWTGHAARIIPGQVDSLTAPLALFFKAFLLMNQTISLEIHFSTLTAWLFFELIILLRNPHEGGDLCSLLLGSTA